MNNLQRKTISHLEEQIKKIKIDIVFAFNRVHNNQTLSKDTDVLILKDLDDLQEWLIAILSDEKVDNK